jgi:flagellar motor switch protein FliN/FliY
MADDNQTEFEDESPTTQATADGVSAATAEMPPADAAEAMPESTSLGNVELEELGNADNEMSELLAVQEETVPLRSATDLEAVYDIPVQLSAVLGKASMQVSQLLKLGRGAVVELDRKVGEAIDIYVNNRLVARGEVVVVEERLGITMTEIIKSDRVN